MKTIQETLDINKKRLLEQEEEYRITDIWFKGVDSLSLPLPVLTAVISGQMVREESIQNTRDLIRFLERKQIDE